MEIKIIARHFALTEAISDYVKEKITALTDKMRPAPVSAHVMLSVEKKYRRVTEIVVRAPRARFLAKSEAPDLYVAIDMAVEKLSRQIIKHKDKLKDHRSKSAVLRKKGVFSEPVEVSIFSKDDILAASGSGEVAEKKYFSIENLTLREAIKEMESSDYNFYVFNNTDAGILSIVYKRSDGRLGLMELAPR